MNILGILIGIYAYCIFFLGIFHQLYFFPLLILTLSFLFFVSVLITSRRKSVVFNKQSSLFYIFVFIITAQISVNLIGALGPELAFDALWYHLTLPKLYLLHHAIYHIPGGLLYYSDMPKLAELLYLPVLLFGNEISVKVLHFSFGILTCLILYTISRRFCNTVISMLVVLLFYENLVVAWESTTAYVDLVWSFYTVLSLSAFIEWVSGRKLRFLIFTSLFSGFLVTTKAIGVEIIIIYVLLIYYVKYTAKFTKDIIIYLIISILIILPMLIFAYVNSGNPFYPFFSNTYPVTYQNSFLAEILLKLNILLHSPDPISPVYLITLPLFFVMFKKFSYLERILVVFSLISLLMWVIIPHSGGTRFLIPFLPIYSLCVGIIIIKIRSNFIKNFIIQIIIAVACISIIYRGVANARYIPYIAGSESKQVFFSKHLNFSFGDFYDTDNYFLNHIKKTDKVLLIGFHNLYYVNFPYIDQTWLNKGDKFNFIATQNAIIPSNYKNWKLVYVNPTTKVKLYTK